MKKFFLLITLIFSTLAFSKEDDIQGKWITEKAKNGNQIIVEFQKINNKYYGEIIQLTIPIYEKGHNLEGKTKIDLANPDEKLTTRPLVGIHFVSDFTYNPEKDRFENGFIYNPENGKTYYCSISFKDTNTIIVKGSLDKSGFIGSKQILSNIK